MKLVEPEEDIIIIADNGTMIRILADQVSKIGRNTQGVTIMKLRNGAKVVAMARTPHDETAEFDQVEVDEEALRQAREEAANAADDAAESAEITEAKDEE